MERYVGQGGDAIFVTLSERRWGSNWGCRRLHVHLQRRCNGRRAPYQRADDICAA